MEDGEQPRPARRSRATCCGSFCLGIISIFLALWFILPCPPAMHLEKTTVYFAPANGAAQITQTVRMVNNNYCDGTAVDTERNGSRKQPAGH